MAIKSSSNKYSQDELELMKKFKCEFLVKLLDAFTVENPFVGRYYCIVMDYYQVKEYIYAFITEVNINVYSF